MQKFKKLYFQSCRTVNDFEEINKTEIVNLQQNSNCQFAIT